MQTSGAPCWRPSLTLKWRRRFAIKTETQGMTPPPYILYVCIYVHTRILYVWKRSPTCRQLHFQCICFQLVIETVLENSVLPSVVSVVLCCFALCVLRRMRRLANTAPSWWSNHTLTDTHTQEDENVPVCRQASGDAGYTLCHCIQTQHRTILSYLMYQCHTVITLGCLSECLW